MWKAEIQAINDNPVPNATAQMEVQFSHPDGRVLGRQSYQLTPQSFPTGDAIVAFLREQCRMLDAFDVTRASVSSVKGKVAVQADGVVSLDKDVVIAKDATVEDIAAAIEAKAVEIGGVAEPLVP